MYKRYIKRFFDFAFAFLLLILFGILYLIIGVAIKLEDRGKVLYCGKRVGLNQEEFKMYKFRSMKENAKDIRNKDGSTFNSDNDDRLTKVGKFIRKTSLDEIPQIINVLKGEMSFIGPRPSPLGNGHLYSKEYLQKFNVRPGITGYNQAYFRNDASMQQRQQNDIYYVQNLSFLLDFKIIIATIKMVLLRKGINRN